MFHIETVLDNEPREASFSDFDALVHELEGEPSTATQLSEGRKWVAEAFYSEMPSLASLRLAAGLSQRQLGAACGIEQPHVSRYESGKHEPSISAAQSMAVALNVSLDTFFQAWQKTRSQLEGGGGG